MQKPSYLIALCLIVLLANGCQYLGFPGVYRLDRQQGNLISQEMIDQLKPGMTKRQVRYVMGNPLIEDTFNPDRWDYIYTLNSASKAPEKQRLTVYFEDDKLVKLQGDMAPGVAQ